MAQRGGGAARGQKGDGFDARATTRLLGERESPPQNPAAAARSQTRRSPVPLPAGWQKVQQEMKAGGPGAPVQYTAPTAAAPPPAQGWAGVAANGDFLAKLQKAVAEHDAKKWAAPRTGDSRQAEAEAGGRGGRLRRERDERRPTTGIPNKIIILVD